MDGLYRQLVKVLYLVEFQFRSGTSRVTNFNQTVTWNGYDWSGLGTIGEISQVREEESLETSPLNFGLNVADPSLIALALRDVGEYRGHPARMWMVPLDDAYQFIGEPVKCWNGYMDMIETSLDGDEGKITLKCETSAYGLRNQSIRVNAAQHKLKYPTDTGFDNQAYLLSNQVLWLSKKFQQI